jgi:dethiobiotin synthetase
VKRLVLIGTGTGVGKTYVGAALVRSWRGRGRVAWGLKPIESGLEPGTLVASDADLLRAREAAHAPSHYRALPEALSPHLAAARAGQTLSIAEAADWVRETEARLDAIHDNAPHAMSLVETAGGAFTPLSATATCVDLVEALRPAHVLLVAPDALGVLHDVTSTLLALSGLGCRVDFVLLSGARAVDDSTGTNAAELERVVFPRLGPAAPRERRVFLLPAGSSDVTPLLDAWSASP